MGLVFLLNPDEQVRLLKKVAQALKIGGRLLFTAPYQTASWRDMLTDRQSVSLGRTVYVNTLEEQGLRLVGEYTDEGENHYYDFQR